MEENLPAVTLGPVPQVTVAANTSIQAAAPQSELVRVTLVTATGEVECYDVPQYWYNYQQAMQQVVLLWPELSSIRNIEMNPMNQTMMETLTLVFKRLCDQNTYIQTLTNDQRNNMTQIEEEKDKMTKLIQLQSLELNSLRDEMNNTRGALKSKGYADIKSIPANIPKTSSENARSSGRYMQPDNSSGPHRSGAAISASTSHIMRIPTQAQLPTLSTSQTTSQGFGGTAKVIPAVPNITNNILQSLNSLNVAYTVAGSMAPQCLPTSSVTAQPASSINQMYMPLSTLLASQPVIPLQPTSVEQCTAPQLLTSLSAIPTLQNQNSSFLSPTSESGQIPISAPLPLMPAPQMAPPSSTQQMVLNHGAPNFVSLLQSATTPASAVQGIAAYLAAPPINPAMCMSTVSQPSPLVDTFNINNSLGGVIMVNDKVPENENLDTNHMLLEVKEPVCSGAAPVADGNMEQAEDIAKRNTEIAHILTLCADNSYKLDQTHTSFTPDSTYKLDQSSVTPESQSSQKDSDWLKDDVLPRCEQTATETQTEGASDMQQKIVHLEEQLKDERQKNEMLLQEKKISKGSIKKEKKVKKTKEVDQPSRDPIKLKDQEKATITEDKEEEDYLPEHDLQELDELEQMEGKFHKCKECGKRFATRRNFRKHAKIHTGARPHKCDQCPKSFLRNTDLLTHIRVHTGEKPYNCDNCDKKFSHTSTLKRHKQTHNSGHTDSQVVCNICGKSFTRLANLQSHLKLHAGEKPFECEQCGRAFVDNILLKKHMKKHSGDTKITCEVCGKGFTRPSYLEMHKVVHTGVKDYQCSVCGKKFANGNYLKIHFRNHSGERPFVCTYCSRSFISSGHLKKHVKTHTGETPYQCDSCGRAFKWNNSLKIHMHTHLNKKPYKCGECGKGFGDSSSRSRHALTHTGAKPYSCPVCDKRFTQSHSMRTHIKSHDVPLQVALPEVAQEESKDQGLSHMLGLHPDPEHEMSITDYSVVHNLEPSSHLLHTQHLQMVQGQVVRQVQVQELPPQQVVQLQVQPILPPNLQTIQPT